MVIAGSAQAQVKLPDHFFDPPDRVFAWHAIDAGPADSAASILEFIDGDLKARETLVAFDSVGVPLYMTVQMTESAPTVAVSDNVLVRFSVVGEYLRIEKPFKDGKVMDEAARITVTRGLSSEEMKKSQQLAVWLWDHRCNR
jgi:hypothetical protein